MTYYCTLEDARSELRGTSNTVDDNRVFDYIRSVSARIDRIMNGGNRSPRPYFEPYFETRAFPVDSYRVNSAENVFLHDADNLLEIASVVIDQTTVTTDVERYPLLTTPTHQLRLTTTSRCWSDRTSTNTVTAFVKIAGYWGYNSDYTNAFPAYDALAADITDNATAVTVADVDGTDPYGLSPRFSPGQLIRIGDEFMRVNAVDTTTDILTVRRAQNGTTATAHTASDSVSVYQVEEPVRRATYRQTSMLMARRGAFEQTTFDGAGVTSYPSDLLSELNGVLQEFQYV